MSAGLTYQMAAETRVLDAWLIKQAVVMDASMGEVIRDEAPHLATALAKATPPLTGTNMFSQAWGAQKKAGVNAVRADIARVYVTANSLYGEIAEQDEDAAKGFRKAVRRRDSGEVQRLLYAYGLSEYAAANIGELNEDLHQQARRRHGRVGRNQRVKQIVTRGSDLNRYRRRKEARVGHLKAGWVGATRGLTKQPRWPAWLRKMRANGSSSDHTRRRSDPSMTLTNRVRYAGGRNSSDRFVFHALVYREKTIMRKVKGMAARKWRK
ncbi:MAG: hypothetical protein ACPG32_04390 [Akkermansiaceae bacterium]